MSRPNVTSDGVAHRAVCKEFHPLRCKLRPIIEDNILQLGVATKPLPVDNLADVEGGFRGERVEFDPVGACINHADGMYFDNLLGLHLYGPWAE
eukprot:5239649-Ditylum_brightwellii.AAC.1